MKCTYCELGCQIPEGSTGKCRCYTSDSGTIVERFPGTYLVEFPIRIETMPLLHFYPQGKFLQVSTIGCNFSCPGCVSEILTRMTEELSPAMIRRSPGEIVARARSLGCAGILFFLNEPAVAYPTFRAVAEEASGQGLLVGFSSNGYFTPGTLAGLLPYIDCAAIGIKGSSDRAYRSCGVPSAAPAFSTIRTLVRHRVHVEVSLVHMHGNEQEVLEVAEKISSISPEIPLQVMRFIAFGTAELGQEPSIRESEALCEQLRRKAPFVYLFNSPGSGYLDTRCPVCGSTIVSREMFGPMGAQVTGSRPKWVCRCGYHLPITGTVSPNPFFEPGMMGGYRPTRALEYIGGILSCLGIADEESRVRVWVEFLQKRQINEMHRMIQTVEGYYETIAHLARLTGRDQEGHELTRFLEDSVAEITTLVDGSKKPRVYYTMGLPGFALNEERFENRMVELAGGDPTNRDLPREGKPGITISPEEIVRMNPDVVMVSGLFSTPVEEVYAYCEEHGVDIPAVRDRRVFAMHPSWDFGNPRWILGLMLLANVLHPDLCSFDLPAEADRFYRKFYRVPYTDTRTNRSFFRPGAG